MNREKKPESNCLTNIPNELLALHTQLAFLNLRSNLLVELSEFICGLPKLQYLYLDNNQLAALPEAIGDLTKLENLNLGNNKLAALPESICGLTKLQYLNLDNNQLAVLPEAIGDLAKLGNLSLGNNKLAALPESICGLTKLQYLNLDNNQLAVLPEAIGDLAKLENLNLGNNQLAALPEAIGGLTKLQHILLNNNRLRALPEAIGGLAKLQYLYLFKNQLAVVPEAIGGLSRLEHLYLDNNQLTELPEAIGGLAKLEKLSLDENQLTALPEAIGRLPALEILSLENNQLLILPESIADLSKLERLLLNSNQLRTLPEAIGGLAKLERLYLDNNRLQALPEAIGGLSKLEDLCLNSNQLQALPEAVGGLAALETLSLDGNQLTYPPEEIVSQGTQAIIGFLAGVREDGEALREAKLVLVGDPAHGKTALRSWFEHDEFKEPKELTRGGELGFRDIDVSWAKGRINIWDFGGQDRYRPAQQPLFTPGALYLLVCKGRLNIQDFGVAEWLRLIQLRAGRDARVLLVFTHMEEHDGIPSLAPLPNELRQMIKDGDIFAIDSPSGNGVRKLIERVCEEARALPRFYHKWPRGFLRARNDVLALRPCQEGTKRQSHISYDRFLEICKPHGVEGASARSLAVAMSLQGRLDYKGTEVDPDQLVVLDPEWLLKAIAYVTDDQGVKDNGGILHWRELKRIWRGHCRAELENPVRFEEHLWPKLLELMAHHDLVYRLSEEEWVVPQSVPESPPAALPWTANGPAIRLDCRLVHPISGLMAFLTVRNHYKHVKGKRLFWQRGAFLKQPVTGAEALITVDGEQTVCMETRGPQSDVLIHDLQETLVRLIYERWPGSLQDEEQPFAFTVPCPTTNCKGRYELTVLQSERDAKREDAPCNKRPPHRHPIAKLLYGIELPTSDAEGRKVMLASRTYGQPPRLLDVSEPPEHNAGKRLTLDRVKIQLYCELSEKLVPSAAATIEVPKDWAEAFRKWAPWAAGHLKTLWVTPDADLDFKSCRSMRIGRATESPFLVCRKAA